jgi:pimeloyl-ACP methyl ester carboxylesterase
VATADYRSGDPGKPLVVFIHGFLQTRNFSTVERLFTALQDSGYPVLAPTLSLGMANRRQALACESIHLHSLDDDAREIRQWVDWGIKKGYREIVLVGHSTGSVNITAFLANYDYPEVRRTILISLNHFGPGRPAAYESAEYADLAAEKLKSNDTGLHKFALSYCKEYVTTAKNFLSYYNWDEADVLDVLNRSSARNYVIIGGADDRLGTDWLNQLRDTNADVILIEGATHFFDQSHEFELLDEVEKILSGDSEFIQ